MGKHGMPLTRAPYMTEKRPGHPVAHADGRVRVHRAVLYDKIGPGPHPCHWCGSSVDWYGIPELVSDHLDGDTWNNDPGNLVPSCNGCNAVRRLREMTACAKGHEFTPENTYRPPSRPSRRMCRECTRERDRARDRRKRAEQ